MINSKSFMRKGKKKWSGSSSKLQIFKNTQFDDNNESSLHFDPNERTTFSNTQKYFFNRRKKSRKSSKRNVNHTKIMGNLNHEFEFVVLNNKEKVIEILFYFHILYS